MQFQILRFQSFAFSCNMCENINIMSKAILTILAIVIGVLLFEYFNSPRPKVDDDARPYIEHFLDLLISKSFGEIHNAYLDTQKLSSDDFAKGMNAYQVARMKDVEKMARPAPNHFKEAKKNIGYQM